LPLQQPWRLEPHAFPSLISSDQSVCQASSNPHYWGPTEDPSDNTLLLQPTYSAKGKL